MEFFVLVAVLCAAFFLVRVYCVLPERLFGSGQSKRSRQCPVKMMVVLGSGGHTSEMLGFLTKISVMKYSPLVFVAGASDVFSESRLRKWEKEHIKSSKTAPLVYISRAREGGQSWVSTLFTFSKAMLDSLVVVFRERPEIIACDGPGTCLPICFAGFLLRVFGIVNTKIVFVESFARVKSLSLTGWVLLFLADRFVVQWQSLLEKKVLGKPLSAWGAQYIGNIL